MTFSGDYFEGKKANGWLIDALLIGAGEGLIHIDWMMMIHELMTVGS